jgi:hypothetical protein
VDEELWGWNGSLWRRRTLPPTSIPPAGTVGSFKLTYDPARNTVLFFGGERYGGGPLIKLGQTWEHRGTDWVQLHLSFPNSASIEIRERTPVAAMPGADGVTRVLDKDGRVLDLIEGQPIALVWISGPLTLDAPAGHFAPPGPSWASALVPKLTPAIRPRVDSMQVTPDGSDLRLYLRPASADPADDSADPAGDTSGDAADASAGDAAPSFVGPLIEVRFGSAIGDNAQIEKLVRLERVLADVDTTRVSVIDVSTAEVTVL